MRASWLWGAKPFSWRFADIRLASILSATKQYATNLMSIYKGGAPNTAKEDVGIWPQPHYWWEGGAA